ncbi:MarR family transcriptional regulator [Duganella sp. FT94W]|uniref:MarR family transcriptional regulator n=1 Tax=Duganella lactea TaxID=2692173 RepID=A0ABW9V2K5_9BURK|nr:MarR family transcriptional regulator [Duganella lactea]MYM33084.1 MarR family transcriptional regulator [Duganella lactea]
MFDHCLYFNTSALARRLEKEWTDAFAPFELTPPQAFMLRAVLARPGMLQKELSDELLVAKSTATRALDALSEKGYIERRAGAGDGREKCIFPTRKAADIHRPLNDASGAVTTRLKKLLGHAEFTDTVSMIKGVRSALQ